MRNAELEFVGPRPNHWHTIFDEVGVGQDAGAAVDSNVGQDGRINVTKSPFDGANHDTLGEESLNEGVDA